MVIDLQDQRLSIEEYMKKYELTDEMMDAKTDEILAASGQKIASSLSHIDLVAVEREQQIRDGAEDLRTTFEQKHDKREYEKFEASLG